jgi:hypothetical protein
MSALLADTGLQLGSSSGHSLAGLASPSLETIEPLSSGELDKFLSEVRTCSVMTTDVSLTGLFQLDGSIEPLIVAPQSDGEPSMKAASIRTQFSNQLERTTTTSSNASSMTMTRRSAMSLWSFVQHKLPSAASLASAAAFFSEHLESRSYRTYSVRTFCESLFNSHRARHAGIVSVKRYGDRFGVPHRFLLFHIVRPDGKDFYIRLDRRRDHDIPLWVFGIRDLGRSKAADTVSSKVNNSCVAADACRLTGCHIWSSRAPSRPH